MDPHADELASDASASTRAPQALQKAAASGRRLDREQELVDEAAAESFPASDAPSYSAMHAGAPAPRPWSAEHGHELRAHLRADLERLAMWQFSSASVTPAVNPLAERYPLAERDPRARSAALAEREDVVARGMLEAERVVVREPMGEAVGVRTVESELVGTDKQAPCVVLCTRYDGDDTRVAMFLAVVRAMAAARTRRSVRFVAVADAPSISGRSSYAARLHNAGTRVHVALSLATLALPRESRGGVFFTAEFQRRSLALMACRAFRVASRIPARSVWVPRWMAWAIGDADLREACRWPHLGVGWTVVTVSDRSPWALALQRAARADVDRIAVTVPGIVGAIERLAG
jgi:hypothetical protein